MHVDLGLDCCWGVGLARWGTCGRSQLGTARMMVGLLVPGLLLAANSEAPAFCADDPSAAPARPRCDDVLRPHVVAGRLAAARRAALALYRAEPRPAAAKECSSAWQRLQEEALGDGAGLLALVGSAAAQERGAVAAIGGVRRCWPAGPDQQLRQHWTACCAPFASAGIDGGEASAGCAVGTDDRAACCAFGPGSDSYQAVPALMETEIPLWLAKPRPAVLTLQQDGFLRPFDMPTVLWPAGYLLATWVVRPPDIVCLPLRPKL